jgi:hypothetical protein
MSAVLIVLAPCVCANRRRSMVQEAANAADEFLAFELLFSLALAERQQLVHIYHDRLA